MYIFVNNRTKDFPEHSHIQHFLIAQEKRAISRWLYIYADDDVLYMSSHLARESNFHHNHLDSTLLSRKI